MDSKKYPIVVDAIRFLAILLLLAGSALSPAVRASEPGQAQPAGQIAYVDNGNLWLYDLSGAGIVQLTVDGGISNPAWSPDGRRLLYQQDNQDDHTLYLLDPDNGIPSVFVASATNGTWSPDGSQIAYITYPESMLIIANSDGTGKTVYWDNILDDTGGEPHGRVTWGQDNRFYIPLLWGRSFTQNIWFYDLNTDSTGQFNGPGFPDPQDPPSGCYSDISNSPYTGAWAITINTNCLLYAPGFHMSFIKQDGGDWQDFGMGGDISWAPDGSWVTYDADVCPDGPASCDTAVFIRNLSGGDATQVTTTGSQPQWRPAVLAPATLTPLPPTSAPSSTPVVSSSKGLELNVTPIAQRFSPGETTRIGDTDTGVFDCVAASTSMVLEYFRSQNVLDENDTTDYAAIRRLFRLSYPSAATGGISPSEIAVRTPELTHNKLTARNVNLDPEHWQEAVAAELRAGRPVIADIRNWNLLAAHQGGTFAHAIVIYGLHDETVYYIDPWDGARYPMSAQDFTAAWTVSPTGGGAWFMATVFQPAGQ